MEQNKRTISIVLLFFEFKPKSIAFIEQMYYNIHYQIINSYLIMNVDNGTNVFSKSEFFMN